MDILALSSRHITLVNQLAALSTSFEPRPVDHGRSNHKETLCIRPSVHSDVYNPVHGSNKMNSDHSRSRRFKGVRWDTCTFTMNDELTHERQDDHTMSVHLDDSRIERDSNALSQ